MKKYRIFLKKRQSLEMQDQNKEASRHPWVAARQIASAAKAHDGGRVGQGRQSAVPNRKDPACPLHHLSPPKKASCSFSRFAIVSIPLRPSKRRSSSSGIGTTLCARASTARCRPI